MRFSRKLISSVVVSAMLLSFANFSLTVSADSNFSGSGTEGDPFLISTATDLVKLSDLTNGSSTAATYINKYYQLTNDIDMSSVANYVPICYAYDHYIAKNGLAGNAHRVSHEHNRYPSIHR